MGDGYFDYGRFLDVIRSSASLWTDAYNAEWKTYASWNKRSSTLDSSYRRYSNEIAIVLAEVIADSSKGNKDNK